MLTTDTLRKIRRIEFRTRKLVDESFAGAYHAVFKGRGMEFDAVRPYEPGDDVRSIDWNVTARNGEPFVKRYVEERELTLLLALDASASTTFGTLRRQKRDLAVELGAVLAYAAISNNDKVGLLVFSDQIELHVPPRKGRNHVLRLIRDLLAAEPSSKGTDLALALQTANRMLKRRSIIFIISDFLAASDTYARNLALTARRHDTIAVVLTDPREQSWPNVGLMSLRDAETDALQWVDTARPGWREQFSRQSRRFQQLRDSVLTKSGVDRIDMPSDGEPYQVLAAFFQRRARRLRER